MPLPVEDALKKVAARQGLSGEKAGNFVFGTMTNMQKRGSIVPWRTLKPTPSVEGGLSRHPESDVHAGLLKGLGLFKHD